MIKKSLSLLVLDRIDCCCVGFLNSKITRFSNHYEGVLAQISNISPGSFVSVIILCLPKEMIKQMTINSADNMDNEGYIS